MKTIWATTLLLVWQRVKSEELKYPDSYREKRVEEEPPTTPVPWKGDYPDKWINIDELKDKHQPYPWEEDFKNRNVLPQTEQIAHTCTSSIERIKMKAADWEKIVGSGKKYLDSSMPLVKEHLLYWPDFPRTDELSFAKF